MSSAASIQPGRRPTQLHVAVDDAPGQHRTDSLEAIWWWTPTLGPTAAIAAAHLAQHAKNHPGTPVPVVDLRALLGLGDLSDRFWKTLDRLERFGVIRFYSTNTLTIRTELPHLDQVQLSRLPAHLAAAYQTLEVS